MAHWMEPTDEAKQSWSDWVASRPDSVRKVAERLNPWTLYKLKSTGQRVTVYSFSEDGTVTVNVTGEFNLITFDRQVFGISPNDLEECDLPSSNEATGALITDEQVDDNIDLLRVTVRPDLWEMDAHGKAVRRDSQ